MAKHFARVSSLFLTLLILASFIFPVLAAEVPSMENVDAVCVINVEHNQIVMQKNANRMVYPTATAKLMTALVADKHFAGRYDEKITVTSEMREHFAGRILGFLVGEEVTVEALLAALLVGGYNDAAVILAYAASGSIEAFCEEMNTYAASLGATNTKYANPTGLHHDEMATTAYDTALIGMEFMKNDALYSLSKRIKYTLPKTNKSEAWSIYSRNSLISTVLTEEYHYSYAQGISFGNTNEGGDCVVTSGTLDGLSYVCVVMGGRPTSETDDTNHAFIVAKNTLRYALANFSVMRLKKANETVATLPVRYSATVTEVKVKPREDLYALVPSDTVIDKDIRFLTEISYESLDAPFEEGTVVGTLKAMSTNGTVITQTDLITASGADAHGFLVFMDKTRTFVGSPWFLVMLALLIGGGVAVFLFCTKTGRKKIRKRVRFDD